MTRRDEAVVAIVCGTFVLAAIFLILWRPIPNAQDAEAAKAIWRHVREGHGGFIDLDESETPGKAIFWRPDASGDVTVDLYEVTTQEDMADVERLAREALRATPGANSVTLRFYEKQNWRVTNNLHVREREKLLREVTLRR